MRTHHICPKCGGHALLVVHDVLSRELPDARPKEPSKITFDAYVCESCQFTEFYSASPLRVDGTIIERIGGGPEGESTSYENWSERDDPEIEELYEAGWADDDVEITEVSRVEKKPASRFGAKVVLTHLGQRPADVLSVLRGTLGLTIPGEKWLRNALPYVVLDLISMDAARGLEQMLEDAGGHVDVQTRRGG